jgi:multidrug efflux pump subunit AcrA (membrane-fusion protein)
MDIKPNKLARYGTPVICTILLLLFSVSWFIKYPETVSGMAKLTGTNAPKPVLVYQSGKLLHLLKQNGTQVGIGEIIGCMETTADWQEILQLSSRIDSLYAALNKNDNDKVATIMSLPFTHLGELQSDYQAFTQSYIPFRDYVIGGYANRKRALLQNDINYIRQSKTVLEKQSGLYEEDIALSQTTLNNNKALLKDHVISEQEYRELSSQTISKKMSLPQMQSGYINVASQQNDKQKELLELDNQIRTQESLFREAAYSFKSKIDTWKRNYLLTASIAGTLTYSTFLQENQMLEAGKTMAFITPSNNSYYLQMLVPQNNLGKVDIGQKVLLKFNAWQWQEYGTVIGQVAYLSNIATDSGYIAKIVLPAGLVTNKNKAIGYKEGLLAQAEIVTNDMRLSERFYYDIIKQLKRE